MTPSTSNDGMRLPDNMLALPNDEQLRSSSGPSGGAAPVIVRPPTE